MAQTEFHDFRSRLITDGRLFNDHEFQAIPKSIYFSKHDPQIKWRRPTEICRNPKFVVDKATRFDLDQGAIGNCWYIAAAATLATKKDLFTQVVPNDQNFIENYAGIFHFYFWRYGSWTEVIIDDKLPTKYGKLLFCHNREEPDEFWSALLEKAYAKLHGSYEALDGGWTEDAFVDFTGGLCQRINLKRYRERLHKYFDTLLKFQEKGSLLGSSIHASRENMENVLDNGLVIGHAYSVTKLLRVSVHGHAEDLVRLRNPWGRKEWKGAWSDGSREMRSLDWDARKKLGLVVEEDGEFWMSFMDWINNFQQLQICHISPDARIHGKQEWHESQFHGKWIPGVSAGGCGNPPYQHLYWNNPQYRFTVSPLNPNNKEEKSWIIVSLMQKNSRSMKSIVRSDDTHISISFDLYKVKDKAPKILDGESYSRYALELTKKGSDYEYYREVTHVFHEEPGTYIVIPSTFMPGDQRSFLLRVYCETDLEASEMDIETGPIIEPSERQKDSIEGLFYKYCGQDNIIDARELRSLLNEIFAKELSSEHEFELEACRSLLCMMDRDKSGGLEFSEVKQMWTELLTWRNTFRDFDKDNSGYINISELKSIFKSVGYNVSRGVMEALVRRYGGRQSRLPFDDFVIAMCKVITIINTFSNAAVKGKVHLDQEEFMRLTLGF